MARSKKKAKKRGAARKLSGVAPAATAIATAAAPAVPTPVPVGTTPLVDVPASEPAPVDTTPAPVDAPASEPAAPRPTRLESGIDLGLLALTVASGVWMLVLCWRHLNFIQIDHGGHIASAATFERGGYHQFDDQAFLGYVHGLFYPPLEDVLLATVNWLTGGRYILAYKLYLTLLTIGYLAAIARVATFFQNRVSRSFLVVSILFLLHIEKPELLDFQGLSFVDLWLTGLSSEVLGGVFFMLLVREWLDRNRPRWLCALLTLTLVSHLVVGFVALLLLGLSWLQVRTRPLVGTVVVALGLSAFFWIPFVVNRSFLTSSNILVMNPIVFAILAIVGFGLGWRQPRPRTLFVVAFVILLPMIVGSWLTSWGIPYPKFHYYRFGIIALFLIVIGFALLLDARARSWTWHRRLVHIAAAALVVTRLGRIVCLRHNRLVMSN
jgi:hypothetical protein